MEMIRNHFRVTSKDTTEVVNLGLDQGEDGLVS